MAEKKYKDLTIYIQNGVNVSKEQKYDFINNNVSCNRLHSLTLSKLLKQIKKSKEYDKPLEEYHEFILDNINAYFKLFFDIDYKKPFNQEYIDANIVSFKKEISNILLDILSNNFDIYLYQINNLNNFIYNNIYISISNNPNKISLHVFFNQILFSPQAFKDFKKCLSDIKKKTNNPLILNIDEVPFRKDTQLRLIYSKKSDSDFYHTEYDFEIKNENDLSNYLITIFDNTKPHINVNKKLINDCDNCDIYPHIECFKGHHFMLNLQSHLSEHKVYLSDESKKYLKSLTTAKINDIIDLELKFTIGCFCKKNSHKNSHFIKFCEEKILLLKHGNFKNCEVLKFEYPKLTGYELTEFIKKLDIIRKIDKNEYVYWDNIKWIKIDEDGVFGGMTLSVLEKYKDKMLLCDKEYMGNKFFKECKQRLLSSISLFIHPQCDNPYIIQFNNGVYDIKNSKFYYGSEAKPYLRSNHIKTNFIDVENMNEKELEEFNTNLDHLNSTFDKIISPNDLHRKVFEANISSTLHYCHKPVITIFYGPTSSGKSTIKSLLRNLLSDMFIELPIDIYQNNSNNRIGPNAWLGKINNKSVSFASEGDVSDSEIFKSKNLKQMTEKYIMGRELNSNKCEQKNTTSQFIDLNPKPKFDKYDSALCKRVAIIKISNTYFIDENLSQEIVNRTSLNRNIVIADKTFDQKINDNKFILPLFYILKQWSNKYHYLGINLLNTPEVFYEITKKMETSDSIITDQLVSSHGLLLTSIKNKYRHLYDELIVIDSETGKHIKILQPNENFMNKYKQFKDKFPKTTFIPYVIKRHVKTE